LTPFVGIAIVQNNPLDAMPGLKSVSCVGSPGPDE
jgi:hypothetical protein